MVERSLKIKSIAFRARKLGKNDSTLRALTKPKLKIDGCLFFASRIGCVLEVCALLTIRLMAKGYIAF
jgi:hypothetical protein